MSLKFVCQSDDVILHLFNDKAMTQDGIVRAMTSSDKHCGVTTVASVRHIDFFVSHGLVAENFLILRRHLDKEDML